jgi:hypothetical protein
MVQFLKADDNWAYGSLLIPVMALAVNVFAQVLLLRARRTDFLRSIIEGCIIGGVALLILSILLIGWVAPSPEGLVRFLFVNIPTYGALSYCYFGVVGLGETSIRIRIYGEIAATSAGMSNADIERLYSEGVFAAMRLRRLLESGDIVERDGRYFAGKNKLIHAAKIMFAAKQFLLGKKSEFH